MDWAAPPARTAPSHDAYPQLAIQWTEDKTSSLVGRIHEGTLDGAIVAVDPRVSGLASLEVDQDRSCRPPRRDILLVRSRRTIAPEALDGAEVLLLEDGHCLRDQALAICSSAGDTDSAYRATSRRRWCRW